MRTTRLIKSSLAYYWQTNLVVVLGVAIAVAVLTGALLIGESVRGSLRDLVSQRLGSTDHIVASTGFFREQLAIDLLQPGVFTTSGIAATTPLIALDGLVTHEPSRRRAGDVRVYGVDERFWKFNGVTPETMPDRQVLLSESLAAELGTTTGDSVLLRIEQPSDIPVESLHGRKEDPGRTIRLSVKSTLSRASLGEFSLRPQQGPVRAIFVPLSFLQRELGQQQKVNTILVAQRPGLDQNERNKLPETINALLTDKATLEDLGLKLRPLREQQVLSLESSSNIIDEAVANATQESARALSLKTVPVLSYLANSISNGNRSVPYSLVTAVDNDVLMNLPLRGHRALDPTLGLPAVFLNEWTARELNAEVGDKITLDYFVWHEGGRLETAKADFELAGTVPITGLGADRDLVPEYPGITESENMSDWDPPFPIDLNRVRKQDEDYWHQYRTTPKAFIFLGEGQKLWQTRFGNLTSIRISANDAQPAPDSINLFSAQLRQRLSPAQMGFEVVPVRDQNLSASRGATDFGEYFLYFSFFLVVSALLLTALFFKLGIEQRLREIGTLQAIGFSDSKIRRLFLTEGVLLAVAGSLLGILGAIGYANLLMYGLRTWWVDAVGTTALTMHISWLSLLIGAVSGVLAAIVCVFLTLRKLGSSSTRGLLLGGESSKGTRILRVGIGATVVGLALLGAGALKVIPPAAGFFGGGVLLLVACVCFLHSWLRRENRKVIQGTGWWTISLLGFRNAAHRPSRTVLCVTLIASAAFIIVAVDAFRRGTPAASDRKAGNGGFPIFAESLLPIVHDANTPEGREALNLSASNDESVVRDLKFVNFRLKPGDDTSCLNLYQPRNPKIVAPPESFLEENRFTFQSTIDPQETNPWLLLNRELPDGAIPVIADANSLAYVLHLKVGDDLIVDDLRLRIVGALSDSIFQSELLMSDKNFVRQFPNEQGYRFFLLDTPEAQAPEAAATLEERLSDFGFDAQSTTERLANFHRVENTYLSTFQLLGGLGLILGTLGMAAVLLRNVFERRRELALLRAVGYNSSHFALMVISENVLMLCCGLAIGFVCALLAIAPVFFERGGRLPNISLGLLLLAVLLSGALASLVATLAALRSPLLPALRAE